MLLGNATVDFTILGDTAVPIDYDGGDYIVTGIVLSNGVDAPSGSTGTLQAHSGPNNTGTAFLSSLAWDKAVPGSGKANLLTNAQWASPVYNGPSEIYVNNSATAVSGSVVVSVIGEPVA